MKSEDEGHGDMEQASSPEKDFSDMSKAFFSSVGLKHSPKAEKRLKSLIMMCNHQGYGDDE